MEKCSECGGNLILCPADCPCGCEFWICEDCESTFCYEERED